MLHRLNVIIPCLFGLLLLSAAAEDPSAQQIYRVYSLWSGGFSETSAKPLRTARNEAMAARGYVWGENVFYEEWATDIGFVNDLPELVARLKETQVDLVWAWDQKTALALKQDAPALPVVALFESDPVQTGVIESLARPGGNVTGISMLVPALNGKRLQLLTGLIPEAGTICVLHNPKEPGQVQWRATAAAARRLGVALQSLEVDSMKTLRPALAQADRSQCAGLLVLDDSTFRPDIGTIVSAASRNGLPVMCNNPRSAEPSKLVGLASGHTCIAAYGPSYRHVIARMAEQADKILKGIPPAEIPVERPTRFELVINLKTAEALGIEIPALILLQADKVIR